MTHAEDPTLGLVHRRGRKAGEAVLYIGKLAQRSLLSRNPVSKYRMSYVWCYVSIISAHRKQRQEDREFSTSLSYITNSRQAEATGDSVSNNSSSNNRSTR